LFNSAETSADQGPQSFPYPQFDEPQFTNTLTALHKFRVAGYDADFGYIPNWIVSQFDWPSYWSVDSAQRTVTLNAQSSQDPSETSRLIAETCQLARDANKFGVLKGWRNELYAIFGPDKQLAFSMERSASPLFGIVTYGVHMTVYVKNGKEIKIWVPRRARNKQTYPGMLDNTVAGGIASGEDPFKCLIREAEEEASLPEDLVRPNVQACGTISYFTVRGKQAGGETGLFQPECQYIYDLEIPESAICKPGDNEAENFQLWSVEEVQKALGEGSFKPNCALVLLDFFVRHGILRHDNEKDFIEIVSRLHRRLEFPTA
jgi:8-oxo-dGTP pyrophosphatase MutT (NUDIX family)